MQTNFYTLQQFVENLYQLKITHLDSMERIQQFCRVYRMHPIQSILQPANLARFIHNMRSASIYHVNDQMQVHYLFLRAGVGILAIGPFCTGIFSMNDCIRLLRRLNLSINLHTSLLAYRDQFPVLHEHQIINIARAFLDALGEPADHWEVHEQEFTVASPGVLQVTENILEKDYSVFIKEHYATEKHFMDDVQAGNGREAIFHLREQQREFQSFKKLGTTLENERIAAAIVRTMVRIAAMKAGLPALTNDLLSRKNTIATRSAQSIEEIYAAKEKMVVDYCNEIKNHKRQGYSSLVSSITAYLEHTYDEPITVAQLAREFHITPNYLTNLFHKETGQTPTDYLRKIRTRHAQQLLLTTNLPIQKVSEKIGIDDSNYFVKLFKKDFGLTPSQYRKQYKL